MPSYIKPGSTRARGYTAGYIVRGYINGQQHELRTESSSRRGAQEAWAAFATETRRIAEAAEQRCASHQPESVTVADAVALYRQSRDWVSRQRGQLLDRIVVHLGDRRLADLTVAEIRAAAVAAMPAALPQSRNASFIEPVSSVLHYAAELKLMPYVRVRRFKEQDRPQRMSRPEHGIIIAGMCPEPLSTFVLTLAIQGWRVTETLRLQRADIDFENGIVRRFVSKSQRWREVALDDEVAARMKALPENRDGRLFAIRDRYAVYEQVDTALRGTGMSWRPHQSRRGMATTLMEEGESLPAIAEAGGWENPKSVCRYIQVDVEQTRRTIAKMRAGRRARKPKLLKVIGL